MKTVIVANTKGGVGRTTLSIHMAVAAASDPQKLIGVLDLDKSRNATEWIESRHKQLPTLIHFNEEISDSLARSSAAYLDIVFIDTPSNGGRSMEPIEVILPNADLIIVPIRPSPNDLRALGAFLPLLHSCGRPFLFVVNCAHHGATITQDMVLTLAELGPVSPIVLGSRGEFLPRFDGLTVLETAPDSRAAREIGALWNLVKTELAA
ncbi:ParA family protein [Nitrospirillum sp. BR 11828]|uniref:ParA family protein n=1 Tax=Nitrospirillum sp. BR 11828 TaxID=3104325 RepID=UPI002ACA5546|nr:ParA family protein [Nitrospirillum sp. BR 11828]MDZ5647156.1 ParA family protein [Nitrospirillum sp. BR 11828]